MSAFTAMIMYWLGGLLSPGFAAYVGRSDESQSVLRCSGDDAPWLRVHDSSLLCHCCIRYLDVNIIGNHDILL